MSHLQFQSKRFILRHAWLNLWDERITTGRINQVAILYCSVDRHNLEHYLPITPVTGTVIPLLNKFRFTTTILLGIELSFIIHLPIWAYPGTAHSTTSTYVWHVHIQFYHVPYLDAQCCQQPFPRGIWHADTLCTNIVWIYNFASCIAINLHHHSWLELSQSGSIILFLLWRHLLYITACYSYNVFRKMISVTL